MSAFLARRIVWVPALAAWLVFGVGLSVWVANLTYLRYAGAASDAALHVTGTSAPADMPSDFPIYPGGQVVEAFTTPAAPGSEGVMIETPDSETTVFAYYDAALRQSPWRVNLSVAYPLEEISCLHLSNPELSCSLIVQRAQSGKTLITFEWVPIRVAPKR